MSLSAPEWFRFCPRCGAPVEIRPVGHRNRPVCPACDYKHFVEPKVGVGVFVLHEGQILLVRRAMEPERGKWSLPAGFLDPGEDPRAVAARETWEETHLDVEIEELIDVYHNPPDATGHVAGSSIFILYRGRILGGELVPGDDADDARFFAPEELPPLAFRSTRDMVKRFLK